MPGVEFVLPHWLYWAGLAAFPLIAMYLSRQAQPERGGRTIGIAYFIWLVGGFLGLHRIYLKSRLGALYWPLFAAILLAGSMEREVRVVQSDAVAAVDAIHSSTARTKKRAAKAEAAIRKAQTGLNALAQDDEPGRKRLERRLAKEQKRKNDSEKKLSQLETELVEVGPVIEVARADRQWWSNFAFYTFLAIAVFMFADLLLIPGLTRKVAASLADNPDDPVEREPLADDSKKAATGIVGVIDRLSLLSGEFVAFWSVIAVFVYYYEVIVRYVFNSPTNWAHESMFLMFGMQYLIAGSYAMLTESHVRVDILYAKFSPRGKAIVDLLTSVFFFIFAGTLLVTGWIFSADSIRQNEVSFTEWAIQYWPVKCVIVIGSVLLILQGISKLAKDLAVVATGERTS